LKTVHNLFLKLKKFKKKKNTLLYLSKNYNRFYKMKFQRWKNIIK
jgi:hypothetical protein